LNYGEHEPIAVANVPRASSAALQGNGEPTSSSDAGFASSACIINKAGVFQFQPRGRKKTRPRVRHNARLRTRLAFMRIAGVLSNSSKAHAIGTRADHPHARSAARPAASGNRGCRAAPGSRCQGGRDIGAFKPGASSACASDRQDSTQRTCQKERAARMVRARRGRAAAAASRADAQISCGGGARDRCAQGLRARAFAAGSPALPDGCLHGRESRHQDRHLAPPPRRNGVRRLVCRAPQARQQRVNHSITSAPRDARAPRHARGRATLAPRKVVPG